MDIDPQSFFGDLTTYSHDVKGGPYQCYRLLETLNRNLIEEQINSSFIDLYLIHIFEKSNGLIYFIETTIKNKNFKNATNRAVEILYTLVNNFPSRLVESNILDIYSLSINLIKSNATSEVKVKILELLLVSLEKLDICIETEAVSSIYKQLLSSLQNALRQNHSDTVKHKELVVLGFFVKRYQYLVSNPKESQQLFIRSLEPEILKPKKSQNIICGFFLGFSYYCESFPLNLDNTDDKKLIERLYKFIKVLVVPSDKIKIGNRAAILFLSNNINVFGELLLKEYKFWHTKLLNWLELGADDKKAGVITLKAFLQVTSTVVYEKNEDQWRSVVEYFNQWCKDILKKDDATNYENHLALLCLKLFSGASYKHLPQSDVTELFVMIMQTFEYTYILNYNPTSEEWQYLPDYVQTVANFMQFKTFTASEFYCLQRAVINMIKSFHQLPYLHYSLVIDGIVTTCFYLKKSQYFDAFVENVIYQGVVWSCSHQHISNAEFSEETTEKIITVKNFLPLWVGVLKLTSNRTYDKFGLYLEDRKYILERIVNQLVKTLMILINKLNLSVKLKEEDMTLMELEKAYQVEHINDYAIFLNLIDFYKEILNNIEPRMFSKCICKIIKHIVNKCVQYPLISGFYKLLSYSLKIANKLHLFEEQDANQDIVNSRETLTKFLEILLEKMIQYRYELLIACLQVLLDCPVIIVKEMLAACAVPFITVFNVGRSYFPLAEMGLDTLEYWQDNMDPNDINPLLSKIVASLDTYLRSKSLQGQTQTNIIEKRRKTVQTMKKRKVLLELEPVLVNIQKRILTFIGKQDSKICQAFVYSDNSVVPTLFSGENVHLKITLPYEDVHLDIYLDTLVPRVVTLALYCSDRKTRITACEVLQAIVMIFLGRAKPMSQSGLSELEDLLKTMAMPLLQLGCDIDQLVQQIFEPLFLQLIHWYTSPTQLRGSHTAIIIDALMEGITHPTDTCLRDFSGQCINEFIKWTIKQTNESALSRDPANIKVLVKKMRFFSSHPDYAKKLGAALIFNNIYRELREEESLISIFWLEILHIFVTSLSLIEYNSLEDNNAIIQINNSLCHIQRVFVEKPQLFRTEDDKRRVPSDIKGSVLKDVAVWLLQQTGNRSRNCRESCMDLFITIAPLVSDKKVKLQVFVRDNFTNSFVSDIYEESLLKNPTLTDMTHSEDCTVLLKWLQGFLCALDGYNFIIKNNLGDINFVNNVTFGAIDYFLKNLYNVDMSEALNLINHKSWTFTSLDRDQFNKLRSACVISILKLFSTVMNDEILCKKSDMIWTKDFWKLILNVIFHPHLLGLDNSVIQPKHLELLTILLNNLPRKISENKIFELVELLHNFIEGNCFTSIDLKTNVTLVQRNIIRGLLLLHSTNINKQLKLQKYTTGLVSELMQNFYSIQDNNVIFVNELQDTTSEHVALILLFSLTNQSEFNCFVNHLCQPYLVQSMEFNKELTFGIYFLNIFQEVIMPFLIGNFESFLNLSIDKGNLNLTVEIVMFILNFVLKNKEFKQHYNDISKILLEKWTVFKDFFNASDDNVHLGVEYLKLFMPICKLQTAEFYLWLVQHLLEEDDLNNKLQIFYLLVDTVDDKTVQSRNELENGFSNLYTQVVLCLTNADANTLIFDKMLGVIPNVKSSIILKMLVQLYLKLSTNTDISSLLAKFMRNIDKSLQQSTLNLIYDMSSHDRAFEEKYKIIKDIMPPLFQKCNLSCFEKFYEEHINEIISKLQDKDNLEINVLGFVLVEILFLRIPIGTEERNNCSISKAANNPKLLQLCLKFALDAFKNPSTASEELLRLYKCHAYNALASIVSNSLKSPSFYEKLFIRQENNQDILWNGIIDTSTVFEFPVLFDSIPSQRKVLTNIRDEIRAQQRRNGERTKSMKYIESQRLFNSSLSEDVTNFDFTNTILRSQKVPEDPKDTSVNYQCEIQLDAINVNNHECMATVCGLIQHIFNSGITDLPEKDEEVVLPNWMKGMRTALLSRDTHRNIKIFLVKVIDNMIVIFNHYSNWFLEPLMQFIVDKCAGNEINYFVTDVIIILAKWASNTVNLNERECQLASDMLYFLISNLKYERLDVFKYNLDLIKLIVESWKNYIKVPAADIFQLISTENKCEIGIHLTSIFLVNNLAPWQDVKIDGFISLLLKRMDTSRKSVYRPCAETVGLALKYLKKDQYSEKINTYLKKISDFTKYVNCLEGVAIHFPQIVSAYHVAKLISSLNQFPDTQKILHLKIIHRRAEVSLDILDEISDFKIVEWDRLLENANLEIQIITLEIIKKCLSVFMSYRGYANIIKTLLRNISNSNLLYRNCVYDIAMLIYQQNKDDLDICKEILIFGLVDSDKDNREKVIKFWTENSNVPRPIIDRFPYLLSNLYKTKIEDQFLSYINYFLITVVTTEEFDLELFEHPLEDCNFEDYKLQTNWRLQHPSVVPLFADTLQTYNDFLEPYDETDLLQLKQTQTTFEFAPTQSVHEREFSKFTSLESSLTVNVSDSANGIKNPNDLVMSQKYRLPRRRFLKDKSKISISHAHYEVKKKVKQVQQRIDLAKEREKQVNIYRNYRKGDFPDIQILLSSVLKPLQMLSLCDSEVSKMLFSEIFKGLVLKVEKNDLFLQTVSDSIRFIFNNSTYFNSNLFSTLLDILLRNKDKIQFEPQLLSYVCQQSGLVSVGTLLLEEYLISYDDQPSGSKKGTGTGENTETVYWVKLAELYKELEEWDVVRSIFLEKMNCKDIIQKAIKYESEAQWRNAQELYKQLIETDMSAERKDFYYESYFKCFANLGEWEYLPETINSVVTTRDTDNAWDILWDNGWYQQKLLPWYIIAHVKNTLFSQTWPEEFSKDINKCLSCAEKAEYLQTNFSEELCMMWLFKRDIASAKYYLQSYIKNFLGEWQLLNPMFQSLRYNKILKLRNFIEIDQFISTYNNLTDDFGGVV
ncbi:hypothetical protein NQ314_006388 [Rhamnusium bicolor]|uniref:DNA-dependent protein kinase catalytic subunit CC3 domain-containing protein n=1 Tax=Rhamnusium bicolor TaxID=1586634 RepID=A0AAV8Z4X5_9CUCU|nr:hypothetical protein NQ314_006388 [Rhamnusium bicolor]